MIQVNATTHTKGGVTVNTGSLLDVRPHFLTRVIDGLTKYDIAFDVTIYKNMADYQAQKVLVRDYMDEYLIGYKAEDVNIQLLTSVTDMLDLLRTHIENGDAEHSGVGVGNTVVVYPPIV